MKLHQLIKALQKVEQNKGPNIEVEVFFRDLETTLTIDSVRYVEEYNYENASKAAPSVLLAVSE
jgi:hypothetical protein